ncbi:MAG: hypothetical protein DRP87_09140 [Spirochaetes bacterium]|nr:MAG: hypothetical protein DRP87_09140 [Spirochaetota bacterium]
MTGLERRHVIEGFLVTLIGTVILILIPSQVNEIPGMETKMSPSFIPMLVGVSLIAVGVSFAVLSIVGRNKEKPVELEKEQLLRAVFTILLLVAYTFLFSKLGFLVTSGLFYGIFSFIFGARNLLKLFAGIVAVPVVIWFFFEIIFIIPLPHGLLY